MRGNFHAQFLEGRTGAIPSGYSVNRKVGKSTLQMESRGIAAGTVYSCGPFGEQSSCGQSGRSAGSLMKYQYRVLGMLSLLSVIPPRPSLHRRRRPAHARLVAHQSASLGLGQQRSLSFLRSIRDTHRRVGRPDWAPARAHAHRGVVVGFHDADRDRFELFCFASGAVLFRRGRSWRLSQCVGSDWPLEFRLRSARVRGAWCG